MPQTSLLFFPCNTNTAPPEFISHPCPNALDKRSTTSGNPTAEMWPREGKAAPSGSGSARRHSRLGLKALRRQKQPPLPRRGSHVSSTPFPDNPPSLYPCLKREGSHRRWGPDKKRRVVNTSAEKCWRSAASSFSRRDGAQALRRAAMAASLQRKGLMEPASGRPE